MDFYLGLFLNKILISKKLKRQTKAVSKYFMNTPIKVTDRIEVFFWEFVMTSQQKTSQ